MVAKKRNGIPEPLKRKVLLEAGHRCAIPTCRHIEVEIHHIIPWEKCQKHEYHNLIALCPNCHKRADDGKIDRKSLKIYKANLCFAIEKFSHFEIDALFELSKPENEQGTEFPKCLNLLIKRLLDADYVQVVENINPTWNDLFIKANPDLLLITDKGRKFIESLNRENIGY